QAAPRASDLAAASKTTTATGITRFTSTGTGPRIAPIGSNDRSPVISRRATSRVTNQRQAHRRPRRRLRANQNIAAAIMIVTTASIRKPGSTMANGMALNPATSEKLACTTTSTDAISRAPVSIDPAGCLALGPPGELTLDALIEVGGERSVFPLSMIQTCSIGGVVMLVEPTGQVQKGVSKENSKPKGEKQMPSCWCHCV